VIDAKWTNIKILLINLMQLMEISLEPIYNTFKLARLRLAAWSNVVIELVDLEWVELIEVEIR